MIVAANEKWLKLRCTPVAIRVPDLDKLILQVLHIGPVLFLVKALRMQRRGHILDVRKLGFLSEDVVKDEADEGEAGAAGDDNEGDDEGEASAAGDDNEEVESPVEESPQPKRARVRKGL